MHNIKIYTAMGCPYCKQYKRPKQKLNTRLPIGSSIHDIDLFLDPRNETPQRILGDMIFPMVTVTKRKIKPLFFSNIVKHEYTNAIYSAADEYSNYIFLKALTS